MTVHRGGIEKYLDPALQMVTKYGLGQYYEDRLELVKEEIREIFIEDEPVETMSKQFSLTDFMRSPNQKSKP